tara:strand:+ start:3171 stop:3338 length:168 start_codon:yes stop_codon:yes gene_type:complete
VPKFVVGLSLEDFGILCDYFSTLQMTDTIEESIIYGIISQLVTDYEDTEPELFYE